RDARRVVDVEASDEEGERPRHEAARPAGAGETDQEPGRKGQQEGQGDGDEAAQREGVVVPDADLVEVEDGEAQAQQKGEEVPRPSAPKRSAATTTARASAVAPSHTTVGWLQYRRVTMSTTYLRAQNAACPPAWRARAAKVARKGRAVRQGRSPRSRRTST